MVSFHADDFALAVASSKDIIALCQQGKVDSLSVIPNISCFDSCMKLYQAAQPTFPVQPVLSVHLNVMEGRPVSNFLSLKDLADEKGLFKVSWLSLLAASFTPWKRGRVRAQLAQELAAQIRRCLGTGLFDKAAVNLDSHQHPHHIPIFFDAMMDAVADLEKEGCRISCIRCSEDPLSPYLATPAIYGKIKLANVVKCAVLNLLSAKVKRGLKKKGITPTYLSGVFFSGAMTEGNLRPVLPKLIALAERKGRPLELLFHPGQVPREEIASRDEYQKPDFVEASCSPDRAEECRSMAVLKDEFGQ
ncbi:MAG: ChbG/HpnK family deacetylase [Treponema sp.]|nr:ChbG/HpnK family deacetylase [Treponema sp.]